MVAGLKAEVAVGVPADTGSTSINSSTTSNFRRSNLPDRRC